MDLLDMHRNPLELPYLMNIGIVITYKCQVACPHCILEAGPNRKEVLSKKNSIDWISQIASYNTDRVKILSLTGGEPFFDVEDLKRISDYANSLGLIVSVVTNAFWALSEETATRILEKLKSIKWLTISTDSYHQDHIPVERVKYAVYAANKCNIPYSISVCTENKNDPRYISIINELVEFSDNNRIQTALTFLAGRALKNMESGVYEKSKDPPVSACSAAKSPIIFPNGRVCACIGPIIDLKYSHPLVLGNLNEETLHSILDRSEQNTVLHAIRVWGPRKLVQWIKDAGLGKYLPTEYIKDSICNTCYSLFTTKEIVDYLRYLLTNYEYREKVAYARVHYLNESRMIEFIQD